MGQLMRLGSHAGPPFFARQASERQQQQSGYDRVHRGQPA